MFGCCCCGDEVANVEPILQSGGEKYRSVFENDHQQEMVMPQPFLGTALPEKEEAKKEAPKEEPKPHVSVETFDLFVRKDVPLGLVLDDKPHGLTITNLGRGAFAAYSTKASKKAQPHDIILKVNGKAGKDAIMDEVKSCSGQVIFTIARPPVVEVTISKNGKLLGMELSFAPMSMSIDIKGICDGALKDYLASAGAHVQIASGDCILSVNGISGDLEKMVAVMKESNDLKMQVSRASQLG